MCSCRIAAPHTGTEYRICGWERDYADDNECRYVKRERDIVWIVWNGTDRATTVCDPPAGFVRATLYCRNSGVTSEVKI